MPSHPRNDPSEPESHCHCQRCDLSSRPSKSISLLFSQILINAKTRGAYTYPWGYSFVRNGFLGCSIDHDVHIPLPSCHCFMKQRHGITRLEFGFVAMIDG